MRNFYPRSPRGERRIRSTAIEIFKGFLSTLPARGATYKSGYWRNYAIFLSTLPARGATYTRGGTAHPTKNFYPRSPRGERLGVPTGVHNISVFLSTLPARGATAFPGAGWPSTRTFLSTLPARGATLLAFEYQSTKTISIHAPREGSDHAASAQAMYDYGFLSTLPARGATGRRTLE